MVNLSIYDANTGDVRVTRCTTAQEAVLCALKAVPHLDVAAAYLGALQGEYMANFDGIYVTIGTRQ